MSRGHRAAGRARRSSNKGQRSSNMGQRTVIEKRRTVSPRAYPAAPPPLPVDGGGTTTYRGAVDTSGLRVAPAPLIDPDLGVCQVTPPGGTAGADPATAAHGHDHGFGRPAGLAGRMFAAVIIAYRRWISPALPARCRFYPSCSAYALEAVTVHGAVRGGLLSIWRLLRCQPFHPGGYDPVPPKKTTR